MVVFEITLTCTLAIKLAALKPIYSSAGREIIII